MNSDFLQILLTHDSARVHREVQRSLPVLRRLARQKLNEQQVELMTEILDELAECVILACIVQPPCVLQDKSVAISQLNVH